MRVLGWLIGLAALPGLGAAVELSPQDFAFGAPVVIAKEAAGYRFMLPLAVYRDTARDDLGDLRVFNAAAEAVPYALLRPQPAAQTHEPARALSLFPLRGSARIVIDGVRLTVDSPGTAVDLHTQAGGAAATTINQYIVDGRALTTAVAALRLNWAETAADYSGRVKVEVSDDLGNWRTVAEAAPTANLHANGQALIENRVGLAPTRAKFWRISWIGPPPSFELTSVLAEPADSPVETAHLTLDVDGTANAAEADADLFDLGAHLPVSRLNVLLPETNTVYTIELSSRRAPTEPWRIVSQAGFYRLKAADGERQNAALEIGVDRDRYWRARVIRGGGAPQPPLHLHVEWVPNEITFLARGQGPYLLAYGNSTTLGAESDLSQVPAGIEIAAATLGEPEVLGGTQRLHSRTAVFSRRTMLWGVLLLAVLLLCWMTYRVAKAKDA